MVSAQNLLIIGGIILFLVAGGGSLIAPAFAQAKSDIGKIRGGVSENVKNIKLSLQKNGNSMDNNSRDRAGEMIF